MEIKQQVTKCCGKEEKLLLRSNFSSFPQYFQYTSNFRSQITYSFVKCGCSVYFFLSSANLICRGKDSLKYFRESLGLRDNGSRLYMVSLRSNKKYLDFPFYPFFLFVCFLFFWCVFLFFFISKTLQSCTLFVVVSAILYVRKHY